MDVPVDLAQYDPATGNGAAAVEFVTPCGDCRASTDAREPAPHLPRAEPHVRFLDLVERGYVVVDVTPERLQGAFFHVRDVERADGGRSASRRRSAQTGVSHPPRVTRPPPSRGPTRRRSRRRELGSDCSPSDALRAPWGLVRRFLMRGNTAPYMVACAVLCRCARAAISGVLGVTPRDGGQTAGGPKRGRLPTATPISSNDPRTVTPPPWRTAPEPAPEELDLVTRGGTGSPAP